MNIKWNEVTWYSKFGAIILFILALPILTFFLGRKYENTLYYLNSIGQQETSYYDSLFEKGVRNQIKEATAASFSGIEGLVTLGPTCPIEKKDENCSDRPFSAHIAIENSEGKVVTETISSEDGFFMVMLEPGDYLVRQASKNGPPTLNPVKVSIAKNKVSALILRFDSGIR